MLNNPSPPSPAVNQDPLPTGNFLNPLAWSRRQKIVAVVLSLLLPPLGLLFLSYTLLRTIKSPAWRGKVTLLLAMAVFIASLLGAYGYLRVYSWRTSQQYHYSYSKLDDFKLPSALENSAISFQKPVEFVRSSQVVRVGGSDLLLLHASAKTAAKGSMAYISASTIQSALAASQAYTVELNKQMTTHKGTVYDSFLKSFQQTVQAAVPANYSAVLSQPTPLSTPNLKANAWVYDLKATNKDAKVNVFGLKGKFVFAAGQRTFYYFTLASIDYNWQPNQTVWQQVLDSIKIDQ